MNYIGQKKKSKWYLSLPFLPIRISQLCWPIEHRFPFQSPLDMIYVSNAFSLSSFAVACVSELLLHDRQGIRGQTVRGVLHSRTLMHTLQLIVFSSLTLSVASQQILDIVSFFSFPNIWWLFSQSILSGKRHGIVANSSRPLLLHRLSTLLLRDPLGALILLWMIPPYSSLSLVLAVR